MAIGRNFPAIKINANIGNSAVTFRWKRKWKRWCGRSAGAADTAMDLSTGRNILQQHPRMDSAQCVGADRHRADLSGAGERSTAIPSSLDWECYKDTLIEQCEQGVDYFTIHAGRAARLSIHLTG